jgi:hypothetical protein
VVHGPSGTLYDQYNNDSGVASSSQNFEASFDAFDDNLADDFVVPSSASWSVGQVDAAGTYFNGGGPANSFNVTVYQDSSGSPGSVVADRPDSSYTVVGGNDFRITLSPAVDLTEGTYWISVQVNMDFSVGGQWGWDDRTVQDNSGAMWENPNDGFGVGCITWTPKLTCISTAGGPDQVFSLSTGGGGGGGSHYTITHDTGQAIVPGTDDVGNHCDDCTTAVALPFPVMIYGQPYSSVNAESNGTLQFTTDVAQFTNDCLPSATHGAMFAPYWDDMRTDVAAGAGIYSTVTGTAPTGPTTSSGGQATSATTCRPPTSSGCSTRTAMS